MIRTKAAPLLILLLLFFASETTWAQARISSPYSRYGVGELWYNNYSTVLSGMGNVGLAIRSDNYLNIKNPASYTGFDTTSFLFDISGLGSYNTLKTTDISQGADYASLGYILFGTPITRWWKASFGLIPFSNVGYTVYDEKEVEDVGNVRFIYEGDGALNQFHIGNAFQITKNLSVGINASYIWGVIDRRRRVTFPDSLSMLSTRIDNFDHISDVMFELGAQYFIPLDNGMEIGTGLVFKPGMQLNATRKYIAQNYFGSADQNLELPRDTVAYNPSQKGTLDFPMGFGGGISLRKNNQFLVSMDFNWRNWEQYKSYGRSDSLQNSYSFHLGGEYIPKHNSITSYFHRVRYRLGFRYENTYLEINNTPIKEFGISFGLGLPFRRSKSMLNFAFEFGNKGTVENNLVQENFVKFTFGLSIYERWFIKARYR
ncbi:MAG: hypothetical protein DRI97_08340 [Bacteroidetes bacterium]|nr:MAG: hypothetical protein DRI83_03245 [Bacteroidota bacterium]RLD56013.1 MAG: hypothetical protein DRI97_08340 [Bacteroidota bacterium]RLD80060.1 MAG: hypothetical protein DRJ15_07955 [Bacteroidota bacterium]